jgi:hypothetical protein
MENLSGPPFSKWGMQPAFMRKADEPEIVILKKIAVSKFHEYEDLTDDIAAGQQPRQIKYGRAARTNRGYEAGAGILVV